MANLQAIGSSAPATIVTLNERLSAASSRLTASLMQIESLLSRIEGSSVQSPQTGNAGGPAPIGPLQSNVGYIENLAQQFGELTARLEQVA